MRFPSVLGLPFALLRTFGIEQRFGFNRTTLGAFALDRLKGGALSLALSVPLLYGLLWLMARPGLWWLWAWLGLVLIMLAMMDAYPRWIAPMFNRFTPLEGPLRTRIEGLLSRCGFKASGLSSWTPPAGPPTATPTFPGSAAASASCCSTPWSPATARPNLRRCWRMSSATLS